MPSVRLTAWRMAEAPFDTEISYKRPFVFSKESVRACFFRKNITGQIVQLPPGAVRAGVEPYLFVSKIFI